MEGQTGTCGEEEARVTGPAGCVTRRQRVKAQGAAWGEVRRRDSRVPGRHVGGAGNVWGLLKDSKLAAKPLPLGPLF